MPTDDLAESLRELLIQVALLDASAERLDIVPEDLPGYREVEPWSNAELVHRIELFTRLFVERSIAGDPSVLAYRGISIALNRLSTAASHAYGELGYDVPVWRSTEYRHEVESLAREVILNAVGLIPLQIGEVS